MNKNETQLAKTPDLKADLAEAFAIRIVKLEKYLRIEKKEKRISDQIFRSGTSIGANIFEAKYAESTSDYIHKLSISQKEANETIFWLRLLRNTSYINEEEFESLYKDCSNILRILTHVITSVRENQKKKSKKP
ncbi:MAG: four helix bundle protein [Muribaculaceae bacterium]|nr:four helix bundle protein [Muribaculaceae bacterium]MDE6523334.1 four helix bundle protein [Muribaculaceae bacterium]